MVCIFFCIFEVWYEGLFEFYIHICSFPHIIVTYTRYLETFKLQNVVYTLHGVCSTLHPHLSEEPGARNTMKTPIIYTVTFAVCCIVALVIGTASAAAMTHQGSRNDLLYKAGLFGPEKVIGQLERQGVNVTEVKTALQNGETNTVREWLQAYRKAHTDEMMNGPGKGSMTGEPDKDRILGMLDKLTAQGYDVLAIQTAFESGNYETAHTLMLEFRTAHPDLFPARGERACSGRSGGHAGGLREAQQ
jgi:hypothetical protein